jgi:hypothetical protein
MSTYNKPNFTCDKCHDTFYAKYGGVSARNSCRQHNYVKNEIGKIICRDCNKEKGFGSYNCYHKNKPRYICCLQ